MLDNKLHSILKKNKNQIKFIATVLDATNEIHDKNRKLPNAFNRTVSNINILLQNGIPVRVRTNIGPNNYMHVPQLAKFYQKQGWFDSPYFKSFVCKILDRYHDLDCIFTEDEAISKWFYLRDNYPIVRKMYSSKLAPSLYNILRATEPRQIIEGTQDSIEISIDPIITHCSSSNRSIYVFTGKPSASIYNCVECSGLKKYRIGKHYPTFALDPSKKNIWGGNNNFDSIRSIDTLQKCQNCNAATFCGGHCALEAINENKNANTVYCNNTTKIISNFLQNESSRLYKRCKDILEPNF